MMANDLTARIESLQQRISKCNRIVSGLENSAAFIEMIEDFKETKNKIDDNWHLVKEQENLDQMRITKLAIVSIINTIQNYKHDKELAYAELTKLQNPNEMVNKDYDNA